MNVRTLLIAVSILAAQPASLARVDKSLGGLEGVGVVVESLGDDEMEAGLDSSRLTVSVELHLRKAGVRVLTEEEQDKSPRTPFLYVNANVVAIRDGEDTRFAYALSVGLTQTVSIEATPTIRVLGETWGTSITGYGGGKQAFKESFDSSLGELLDKFLNDYLAANPRPQQAPK